MDDGQPLRLRRPGPDVARLRHERDRGRPANGSATVTAPATWSTPSASRRRTSTAPRRAASTGCSRRLPRQAERAALDSGRRDDRARGQVAVYHPRYDGSPADHADRSEHQARRTHGTLTSIGQTSTGAPYASMTSSTSTSPPRRSRSPRRRGQDHPRHRPVQTATPSSAGFPAPARRFGSMKLTSASSAHDRRTGSRSRRQGRRRRARPARKVPTAPRVRPAARPAGPQRQDQQASRSSARRSPVRRQASGKVNCSAPDRQGRRTARSRAASCI